MSADPGAAARSGGPLGYDPAWLTDRVIEAPWLADPALAAVIEALGGAAFAVGGCVRNAILGQGTADVDLATPLTPEAVTERLERAGLRAVPTGIEHGTVTAVSGETGFEITTFRADVETDGRRARVAFSTDMRVDAARRDLTINALYADGAGRVIDPLGGLGDVEARRVRFIGDPHDRIREDYLRILRFFRFFAWYGEAGAIDPDGLAACAELADGLDRLARERIGAEMRKLLSAPDPAPAMAAMAAAGVLRHILPGSDPTLLAPLVDAETAAGRAPDWVLRLAVLGGAEAEERLRLSRAYAAMLARLREVAAATEPLAATAYRHGARAAWGRALLHAASGAPPAAGWSAVAGEIAKGAGAEFPLSARDLLARGMRPGPDLGAALAEAEEAWIAGGFDLDKPALLRHLADKGHCS